MASLTCVTCRIKFLGENEDIVRAFELQKAHFQGDWHRYNLKRKTADLPPISAEVFEEKVQILQGDSNSYKSSGWHCKPCSKLFTSENTYNSHVVSKKHLTTLKVQESKPIETRKQNIEESDNIDVEEVSDEEWDHEPLPLEECLFCNHVSENMEENIEHMTAMHGFFIPHRDCVVNLEGLMSYLGEKVGKFHVCLWCYCTNFMELRAVKSHMTDKGHCMIYFDVANPEYSPFYDYDKLPQIYVKQRDDLQVVLPSGIVLGHRDLFIYYKQRAKTGCEIALRYGATLPKQAKMLTWTGATGAVAAVKARKIIQHQERMKSKALLKVGMKANQQEHYNDQNLRC